MTNSAATPSQNAKAKPFSFDTTEQLALLAAAVIESSSDAIITKTLDGVITSWNPSAQRIFGYSAEEAIGKPITILFPLDHVDEEPKIIARIRNGERVDHFETERKTKDGRLIPISLTISPIRDKDGVIIGASKIVRDISAQKAYEQHLVAQANELEQFAYVASHDLREPLRKVAVYSEMLVDRLPDKSNGELQKYARNITDAVNRMQRLIRDLLDFSRADRADTGFEPVDLNKVATEVQTALEVSVKETEASIDVGPLPTVNANAFQMNQLLQNLVSNALKFRRDEAPRVVIRAEKSQGETVVSVSDNGIGIEPAYLDRVFRVFQRLHSADRFPGTGIGLAICKKIVERHGGRIWIESEVGQGSTFYFTLPGAKNGGTAS